MISVYAFFLYIIPLIGLHFCSAINTITPTQFLKDPETLVSKNSKYILGFFSPPNSTHRYVGIWYDQPSVTKEVIWVANRNNPVTDSNGVLRLSVNGNLQVFNARNQTLWSSNVTQTAANFSVAQLSDFGNLVVQVFASNTTTRENGTTIWSSFFHPADSVLPNMRFLLTPNSDLRRVLQAWRSSSDPSYGRYSIGTNSLGLFQIIIWDGDKLHWRSGPWNGNIFIGTRYHNTGYGNILINAGSFAQEEVGGTLTLVFAGANETLLSHYTLTHQGVIAQRWWDDSIHNWGISWKAPDNDCDFYARCGQFGSCNPHPTPTCRCLKGFEPKDREEWKRGNWSSGCVRRKPLQCGLAGAKKQDGFMRLKMMKVPENAELMNGLNLNQCRSVCLRDCTCLAYAYDTQITCLTWHGNLIDVADLSPGGVDLFIRLEHSELGNNMNIKAIIAASILSVLVILLVVAVICFLWRRSRSKGKVPLPDTKFAEKKTTQDPLLFGDKTQVKIDESLILKFETLAEATDDFHESNLLGAGGFGRVYKGKLEDGQEIAVKRLSRASGQGVHEFMNEVELISKLQHRNLVKLLGCCVEGEEKMLIYEFMPNNSLDAFLFDSDKRKRLDWPNRFNIIKGVCRGLLYLHRDSRLRIIHRDLKASNILLDKDLVPKISDFGMARIFGNNQDKACTQRVVGTYGYMAPEYAMEGHFSEKSDVFSLGVSLIEIVSGQKNNNFWYPEESLGLLGYAWKLWNEDKIISLIDPSILSASFEDEIVRCMHVGLLCVQEFAKDRPNMPTVISMLERDIMDLPKPNPTVLYIQRKTPSDTGSSPPQITDNASSTNYITVTSLTAR
ncbi:G-type lectin S-receptor-like serine/threonine-protein kinase At1g11330 [Beta vulgaris subsp. vulgaris]|uniref:G-type lectin S-receptor-like serine/threonine-protein kinase At1g11330 n=1 Tax=Beta vulgaris subsp. vulgaris TaxID=3555 RepID=UPI002036D47A|nr:G-type lectin S-receptor-like serine/threonine-protein kinase At1g11330 [Beta vulgaris subsp. vulgaris]